MTAVEGNVGLALGVVCAAGAATAVGASVVFFPKLVAMASRRVLAGSLGLSAGVMTYVSFAEIFVKSVDEFTVAIGDEDLGYIYATLSFFGGVVLMLILDLITWLISGKKGHSHEPVENQSSELAKDEDELHIQPHCVGMCNHSGDPVEALNKWQEKAEEEIEANEREHNGTGTKASVGTGSNACNDDSIDGDGNVDTESKDVFVENCPEDREKRKLKKMGLSTALAIALHNFPEGLATFVATLQDPAVGAVLAIAIGIHNIPEGLCVALPIYYSTGNRMKAFMWGCLSGLSEPIAALLGWAVLATAVTPTIYAILFGLVSGMMVIISLKELIPTAHRYDPDDTVVTYSLIAGMAVIALSLLLFRF